MIIILRLAILAAIAWGGWKVGNYLTQNRILQRQCDYCKGKGYWLGTRERNFCKKCNGTGRKLVVRN